MKVGWTIILCLILNGFSYAQSDRTPYNMYEDKVVLHTSLSIRDAPINLSDNFGDFDKLKYRTNLNIIQGVGIAYKWFALNINYKLPGHIRDEKYGETKYFDLGLQFSYKKWDFQIDFHDYKGYGIKNAEVISDSLPLSSSGYYLNKNLKSISFGINAYRFLKPGLRMKPAVGIVGRYTKPVHGAYLRLTTNLHGISAKKGVLPYEHLSTEASIHKAHSLSAYDLGAIPGYAYINNINGWQFGAFVGLGAVVQAKFYKFKNTQRGFLGLAPRVDLKLQAGYNVDNWFLMLTSSFDQKNIRFSDFRYHQIYYYLKLTYGYRFSDFIQKKKEKKLR